MKKENIIIGLIVLAILTRLIPHPPNFAPITGIALFSAINFNNRFFKFFVPLISLVIFDLIIGFSLINIFVYLSFIVIVLVGNHFKKKFSVRPAPGVIVEQVAKSSFFESIETFGTAIASNSKTYRVKKEELNNQNLPDEKMVKKGDLILELLSGEKIIAEFDGKLGKREIAQGVLGTDSFIVSLDAISNIFVDIKIPENFVGILKPGLRIEATSDAYDKIYQGKIESVSSRIDPSTRSILARVLIQNDKYELIPGQLLTIKIIYNETELLGVPERSVTIQGNTAFVYVVKDGATVEKRDVILGKRNYGKVSIIDGLTENETIIAEGISKVRDKAKVKIINQ